LATKHWCAFLGGNVEQEKLDFSSEEVRQQEDSTTTSTTTSTGKRVIINTDTKEEVVESKKWKGTSNTDASKGHEQGEEEGVTQRRDDDDQINVTRTTDTEMETDKSVDEICQVSISYIEVLLLDKSRLVRLSVFHFYSPQ